MLNPRVLILLLALAVPVCAQTRGGFDATRAFNHVKALCEMGPHPSGSEAIKRAQDYLEKELKSYGLKVTEDDFVGQTPKGAVPMKNIIGELAGDKPDVVLITGHYDTKRQAGFVGANDGGSSAATVLEMARALAKTKPEYTLWFVLFDGEEAVVEWSAMNGMDNTYGSRHLVARMRNDGTLNHVRAMLLVDMIGDKDLNIEREGGSTQWLTDIIWDTAAKAGYAKNFPRQEHDISDDHLPFLDAGIPAVDLIDFDYGPDHSYWHTNQDTLDKISGASMKAVGDTLIAALPAIFKRLDAMPPRAKSTLPTGAQH
ncbi:MAG TPA: M28 family peptidase [Blastocatellia bacterium]|nr:M28 family peptidase [Blastocatellia bacterium]